MEPFRNPRCPVCGAGKTEALLRLSHPGVRAAYTVCGCRSCGHRFNADAPQLAGSPGTAFGASYFRRHHRAYFGDIEAGGDWARDAKFRRYASALDDLEADLGRGRLLDVGCAHGYFLDHARRRGWRVEGVDVSPHAVGQARSRYGIEVRRGELADAAFPSRSFDAVTLWDVLEHVPDPRSVLGECHRILRPGGQCVLVTDTEGSLIDAVATAFYRLARWRYPARRLHPYFNVSYFDRRALERDVRDTGFRIVESRGYDQPVEKTDVSGWPEAAALRLLLALGRWTGRQTQLYLRLLKPPQPGRPHRGGKPPAVAAPG